MARNVVPRRTCIGCRANRTVGELVRFVSVEGALTESRVAPGRGAWVCAGDLGCLERATRTRAFDRALRAEVSVASIEGVAREWNESSATAPSSGAGVALRRTL